MNETFFSTLDFTSVWSKYLGDNQSPLAIPVTGSGPARTMYGIQAPRANGGIHVKMGPVGLYGSPGWEGQLEQETVNGIIRTLRKFQTRGFYWTVRFDQEPLAKCLMALGFTPAPMSTHVLSLAKDYEQVFAGYNSTMRNQVRKTRRGGLVVREAQSPEDVRAYHQVYTRSAEQKGGYGCIYPVELFLDLIELRKNTRLLLAESEGQIVAGGLYFRDGCSIMYWHGAADRRHSHLFPACAVIDQAVQWGCANGATDFDFGASNGIASLEQFKSFWGARPQPYWRFEWESPFWARVDRFRARWSRLKSRLVGKAKLDYTSTKTAASSVAPPHGEGN
jgi:hypothetical protein